MLTTKTQAILPSADTSESVRFLKGVGPEKEKAFERLGVRTVTDLFELYPRRHESRFPVKKFSDLKFEDKECVAGIIASRALVRFRGGRGGVFKAVIQNGDDSLVALFYHQAYLAQVFKPKQGIVLYGVVEKVGRRIQMVHPEWEVFLGAPPERTAHHGRWVPVYPLTEDMGQKYLRQTMHAALLRYSDSIVDLLPKDLRARHGLMDARSAARYIHFPPDEKTRLAAQERLVFEEFLGLQLFIEWKRAKLGRERPEIAHAGGEEDVRAFLDSLPFKATQDQRNAVRDIVRDMRGARPMNRLVQGDVGSGKTAVAASALYFTARNGFQGALMAPTEVLAQQLFLNLTRFLEPFGIRVGYLSQSTSPSEKEVLYGALERGSIAVLVGTHALLDKKVYFKKLGLAIVDEQHKFGVAQRAMLRQKAGVAAHFLVMTATPIPRTLAMTLYGDMDISVIAEKPGGRTPVKTLWFREQERQAVHSWMDSVLEEKSQAFVICPWVDTSVGPSVKNATAHYETLQKEFPQRRVALLHGRMQVAEKNRVMRAFHEGQYDILVSTVLIEVGVDVPRARFMIIENAEKFGLAQLHQLRGRIGRGGGEAHCILFSESEAPETAERLDAFTMTESGFDIAEMDLAQRGAGELHGQKQHGLPQFKIGGLARDMNILLKAKGEARAILEKDPSLSMAGHRPLRKLLRGRFGDAKESSA